jgi:glycosyltransferase involved in cell wall biosynthesis
MMPPLRVGLLFEYGTLNGGEMSLLAVLDALSDRSMIPVAVCPNEGPLLAELQQRGVQCRCWPSGTLRSRPAEPNGAHWLQCLIDEFGLTLLHANSLSMGRWLGGLAGNLSCPTSAHLRDIIGLSRAGIDRLNRHQILVAVSEATRQAHLAQGILPTRICTVHNGIDPLVFHPRPRQGNLQRELGLDDEALLAGTIGQICLRKGQNILARAAVLLRESVPNLHFVIVGERYSTKPESLEFEASLSRIFTEAGMGERLHLVGFRRQIPALLNDLDLLIHPANQEPLGRVLIEAAATGLPIIATDVGGTREILTHGQSGWLVPPADPEKLAQAILMVIQNPNLRRSLGAAARQAILEKFTAEQAAERLLAVWRATSAGGGTPGTEFCPAKM